jgi:putative Holliday junction resolvase
VAVLALDVGERRIGVAVSDPDERYALPVTTLERTNLHDDLETIVALAAEHRADTIVVGDPIALSGERGLAARKMDEFADVLQKAFAGRIERIDERLTTAQATRALLVADVSRRKRKTVVDRLAAALILETYLARRRSRMP